MATWVRRQVFRPVPLMVSAVIVTAIVLAPYLPWLIPQLENRPEYQFDMADLEITPPHRWVPRTILDEVLEKEGLPETVSLLDEDLCRRVATAWERHPWIEQVKSVRITRDRTLRADLAYRVPVAFVEVPNGLYPIDSHGVLLPPVDFSMSDANRLPHLRGVQTQPAGAAGTAWGDPVVEAAAELAALLAPEQNLETYWHRYGLTAILAPQNLSQPVREEALVFEILTRDGSRIIWGRPPGFDSLEQPPREKLARLELLHSLGKLNSADGPQWIDIRYFEDISLEPMQRRVLR